MQPRNRLIDKWKKFYYYLIQLPTFWMKLSCKNFRAPHALSRVPQRPDAGNHLMLIKKACREYTFLKGRNPQELFYSYNFISVIRESDVFSYLFMTRENVKQSCIFYNLDLLKRAYDKGPVLILYAHTGSYYYNIVATAIAGSFKCYPIAYNINPKSMEIPFRWLYYLNMEHSKKYFNGGDYIYTGTSTTLSVMKRILSNREKAIIYAGIDLPRSFISAKRADVTFLGKKTAFPNQIARIFVSRGLPVFICLPSVEIIDGKIKKIAQYELVSSKMSTEEIINYYACRLEDFIIKKPEQHLNLINLDAFL